MKPMEDARFVAPLKEGGQPSVLGVVGKVDPGCVRSKLMLETLSHMMSENNWPYRYVTVDVESQGDELGKFRLLGANDPDSIQKVHDGEIDIAIMNPGLILSMAHRGVGLFERPLDVAIIAVMPHYDQVGFAVSEASGITSLEDICEKRYPLRLSVRGSLDACTTRLVEDVLRVHGYGYNDIISWGGSVQFDQPMPHEPTPTEPSRVEKAARGELDAIFEEGVVVWANLTKDAGLRLLHIADDKLAVLEARGFTRGVIEKSRFPNIAHDVQTIDFSGWPIYTNKNAPTLLIRKFCEAMEARKAVIPWNFGPINQDPMPIERFVQDQPSTPFFGVPFHPVAREFWNEKGYLAG
jgi:TRAP-type uncharacterized transport system substrate-binding protein